MLNKTTWAMRQIALEQAKTQLRCVLLLTHDPERNKTANHLYSEFIRKFTYEVERSS